MRLRRTRNYIIVSAAVLTILMSGGVRSAVAQGAEEVIRRITGPRAESRIGHRVDAGTGAFVRDDLIIAVQGGRTLDFRLYHNSILSKTRGPMGFGWSHQYEAFIDGNPEGVMTVHWDRSRKNSFRFAAAGSPYEGIDEAVQYDKLRRNVVFGGVTIPWRLTRQDGTVYEFEANGSLRAILNKVNQRIEMRRTFNVLTSVHEPVAGRTLSVRYTSLVSLK